MALTFYGLKTCDTCKKARKALDAANISYTYTDVRVDGMSKTTIEKWATSLGEDWGRLLNKSSTTWRSLDEKDKANLSKSTALKLLRDNPTLMKRPLIEDDKGAITIGWSKDVQAHYGV
ncbi:MAG: Spx/MgsR family RNA polymerase-binding regulatory protein [Pseudomonadota bacterium]